MVKKVLSEVFVLDTRIAEHFPLFLSHKMTHIEKSFPYDNVAKFKIYILLKDPFASKIELSSCCNNLKNKMKLRFTTKIY